VIERDIGLRTHVESGVPLDARLSYDLLATIFRPSAPLARDGAVIVQKDRISAGCVLSAPLDESDAFDAIGNSSTAPASGLRRRPTALAVIVSEETGAISLAVGGKIERDLTVEQLRGV